MDTAAINASLLEHFGFTEFRTGQQQTIEQLLKGESTLAVFPTGSGKSLCYQLTAIHLPHLTLVVSPLLALIKDQLAFLQAHNISAASIDSSASAQESAQVMQDITDAKIKVLMISVERFKNERFRQFIQNIPLSMLVVDEAHCISEWGHNFRPDYLKLPSFVQQLKIPLVLLLTATATRAVKLDMANKFNIVESHIVQTGFYRSNLDLSVEAVTGEQKNARLIALINESQNTAPSCGIVYVTLQKTAEQVASFLSAQGFNCSAYHAGLEGHKRQSIQERFMQGQLDIVIATIAFGMGIDKSDVRFVIHYDLPKSIENYSQEIGRAGRDGLQSNCHTLANLDSINTLENFIYGDTPQLSSIQLLIKDIQHLCENSQWEMQLYALSMTTNIRQLTLKTLLVQLELLGALSAKYSYFAEFKIKLLKSEQVILGAFNQARQEFLKQLFSHINFKRVWGVLDFASLYQEFGVDRAKVIASLEYLAAQQLIELQSSQMTEVYQVDVAMMNSPSLASQLANYFNDKEQKEIDRIQALVGFFERDNCLSFNLAHYFDDRQIIEQGFDRSSAQQNCGHCSACRNRRIELKRSENPSWPSDELIQRHLQGFKSSVASYQNTLTCNQLCCRFLSGISLPIFSKIKARKLPGFGCCEGQRYAEILERIERLSDA